MSIVFDEIVGTVTGERPRQQETEQPQEQREQKPNLAAMRRIEAQLERRQRLQARLQAD